MSAPELPNEQTLRGLRVPRWEAVLSALFVAFAIVPLAHAGLPWLFSLLMSRLGWSEGRPGDWNFIGLILVAAGVVGLVWITVQLVARILKAPQAVVGCTPTLLLTRGDYAFSSRTMTLVVIAFWLGWAVFYGSIAVLAGISLLFLLVVLFRIHYQSFLLGSCPAGLSTVYPVYSAVAGSGSGTGTGTIHGWAFATNKVFAMKAIVMSPSSTPPATAPSAAQPGVWNSTLARWEWTSSNEIPGVTYSTAGAVQNLLVFYVQSRLGGPFTLDSQVNFNACLNVLDPCFPGPGSGSGSVGNSPMFLGRKVSHYPAIWHVMVPGFTHTVLGVFNANWSLRLTAKGSSPAWDNGGDGTHVAKVQLKLNQSNGWELLFSVKGVQLNYCLEYHQLNMFGPLRFDGYQATVPTIGLVQLPPVLISAI
jgi:hypothetical protein